MYYPINSHSCMEISYPVEAVTVICQSYDISFFEDEACPAHWHSELEFVYILSGSLRYHVNQKEITLNNGEGLFINSGNLHAFYSDDNAGCHFIQCMVHPSIASGSSYTWENVIHPILQNEQISCLKLLPDTKLGQDILASVQSIYDVTNSSLFPLVAQEKALHIFQLLFQYTTSCTEAPETTVLELSESDSLRKMVEYIHLHYMDKISLEEIADAGRVCKSTCNNMFQKAYDVTPFIYLIKYRLQKSIDLMNTTNMNISQISALCGFTGLSYFSETFRKNYGITPTQFRKSQLGKIK